MEIWLKYYPKMIKIKKNHNNIHMVFCFMFVFMDILNSILFEMINIFLSIIYILKFLK